jgi:cell division transport system permease protein
MFTTLFRITKFAWQDFWRNIWLTIITITVITLTLISISLLAIFNDLTAATINSIQKKIDVSIYLKNTVTNDQIKQLNQYLERIPEVDELVFVSSEQALKKFRKKHQSNEAIISSLEELGENPLGPSFVIRSEQIENYPIILNKINEFKNTDIIADKNFDNYQLIIARFDSFSTKVKQVGLGLSIIFGIITILIVFNTIRVSIYTHEKEIGIMKLVGATNLFIRAPYLAEGIVYSIVSAILTYLIFYPLVNIMHPHFWQYFEGTFNLQTYFFGPFVKILFFELMGMIIINIIASSFAIRRYLKE